MSKRSETLLQVVFLCLVNYENVVTVSATSWLELTPLAARHNIQDFISSQNGHSFSSFEETPRSPRPFSPPFPFNTREIPEFPAPGTIPDGRPPFARRGPSRETSLERLHTLSREPQPMLKRLLSNRTLKKDLSTATRRDALSSLQPKGFDDGPGGCDTTEGFRFAGEVWYVSGCRRRTCIHFRGVFFTETDSCDTEIYNTTYKCIIEVDTKADYPHCCPTYRCNPDNLGNAV